MALSPLVEEIKLRIRALSPLHVGGERGIRPSVIDLKVFRRYRIERGDLVSKVVIPGSSIKGVMRTSFEDALRRFVVARMGLGIYELIGEAIGAALAATRAIFGDEVLDLVLSKLAEEQQVIEPDSIHGAPIDRSMAIARLCNGIVSGYTNVSGYALPSDYVARLASLVLYSLTSFIPLVCDPTTVTSSCIADTALLDVCRDRLVSFRFFLNIALGRKRPLRAEMCPVCLLFGGVGRASPTVFEDAEPTTSVVTYFTTRVAIDRHTKGAKRGKLFTLEYVPPGTEFVSRIYVLKTLLHPLYANNDLYRAVLQVLTNSLKAVGIGGMRSVGYGLIDAELENSITVDPSEVIRSIVYRFAENLGRDLDRDEQRLLAKKLEAAGCEKPEQHKVVELIRRMIHVQGHVVEKLVSGGGDGVC